ncbi:ABC transporter permease [Pseudonocardia nigra]|uniref:ABC transporter permease n=1 Tax=Pseudonocardia nigra TaxID=1921578 RepID=UPI001C5D92C1|nr:ABC transporter permease [Pseudonocardia nigra]
MDNAFLGPVAWLRHDRRAAFAAAWLLLLVAVALTAPLIAPYDPAEQDLGNILAGPSAEHWLGTDDLGRDYLSRLLFGGRVSLLASIIATGVGLLIGVPVGLISGFVGGVLDNILMRIVDTLLSFPAIVLAISVIAILGPGLTNAMIAVGIIFAPSFARLVRGQVLAVKGRLYVDAARTFGSAPHLTILRHVVPNSIQPVIVQTAFLMAVALLAEAALSFLGLGVQPPTPSWGEMLQGAARFISRAPLQVYPAGLAIAVTVLAFNLLGDSMRDALDPVAHSERRLLSRRRLRPE